MFMMFITICRVFVPVLVSLRCTRAVVRDEITLQGAILRVPRAAAEYQNGTCSANCDPKHGSCDTLTEFKKNLKKFNITAAELKWERQREVVGVYSDQKVCVCKSGYQGVTCLKRCTDGHGSFCRESCSPNCAGRCNPQTGECMKCKAEFIGKYCLIRAGEEEPQLDLEPFAQSVRVGERAAFTCRIVAGNPDPVLEWKRVGEKKLNPKGRFHNDVFIIPKVTPLDTGEYMCIARNKVGKAEALATLWVTKADRKNIPNKNSRPCNGCPPYSEIERECLKNDWRMSANFMMLQNHNLDLVTPKPKKRRADSDSDDSDGSSSEESDSDESSSEDSDSGSDTDVFSEPDDDDTDTDTIVADDDTQSAEQSQERNTTSQQNALITELGEQFRAVELGGRGLSVQRTAAHVLTCVKPAIVNQSSSLRKRQAGTGGTQQEIQIEFTSTFPSSLAKGLNVRAMYNQLLVEFSDVYQSKVIPGLFISKESIKVRSVTRVSSNASPSSTNNDDDQKVLYVGLTLVVLFVLSVATLFTLRKRYAKRRAKLIRSSRFRSSNMEHGKLVSYTSGNN